MRNIFKYQIWHLLILLITVFILYHAIRAEPRFTTGSWQGIQTVTWFWIAISVAVFHQLYVWFIWRMELYYRTFTKRWGTERAFTTYAAGFAFLILCRLATIIILAISNKNSLSVTPVYTYLLSAAIIPIVIYLFYSIMRYFTVKRAFGYDHFNTDFNEPLVKKGIFKFSNNAMYLYGLLLFYLPGLLLNSSAALLAALFTHGYIWIHFFCTEKPDMKKIYGQDEYKN